MWTNNAKNQTIKAMGKKTPQHILLYRFLHSVKMRRALKMYKLS